MRDFEKLVQTWIALHQVTEQKGDKSEEIDELFWAFETLESLVLECPDDAWHVILQILDQTENSFVLNNLAAGPLEEVLARHGSRFIFQAEKEAQKNERFKELLLGVWQNTMTDEMWVRIQKAASS